MSPVDEGGPLGELCPADLGGRQLGYLLSGRERFRSAAECEYGVGMPTGMLHLVDPLRPGPDVLEDHLLDELLSMAGITVEGAAPAMG